MTVKLLAIETATEACSAALTIDGEIIERYQVAPRQHNQLILQMCEELLSEAEISVQQLDAMAFGCGPGAFTGLRIAASVTQAIAIAHDLPVASVSTLANLAQQAEVEIGQRVMSAIDARMEEIYWALYEKLPSYEVQLIGEEKVQSPHAIDDIPNVDYACGTGWATYLTELNSKCMLSNEKINDHALPRAAVTAQLGMSKYHAKQLVTAEDALPVYLRNQVAHQK